MKHPAYHMVMALVPVVLLLQAKELQSQSLGVSGQAIGWFTMNPAEPFQLQAGLRYLPELSFSLPAGDFEIDGKVSANLWGSGTWQEDSISLDENLSPYRMWIRFSGDRFELRAGLQKINFGSARLFRPLMWFDRIDPRDPLQLTDGVYGLLARYYFLNNANVWIWGLYGEEKTKGWETIPTRKKSIEYGARVQFPLYTGEIAGSFHHRTADPRPVVPDTLFVTSPVPENRIGFDVHFDMLLGVWAEAALIHQDLNFTPLKYTSMINAGADYTFNLGNGLSVTAEGFGYLKGESAFGTEENLVFGLLSASYPLSIIHNLQAMLYYDFTDGNFYRFLNWSLTYDRWDFYLMGFWNPESYNLYNMDYQTSLYGGWGFQLMAVFTH